MSAPNFTSLSGMPHSGLFILTESEWNVLLSITVGETADVASDRLCITAKSYHNYKHRIGDKLGCKGRGKLELFAQDNAKVLGDLASLLLRKPIRFRPISSEQMWNIKAGSTLNRTTTCKKQLQMQKFNTSIFEGINFCFSGFLPNIFTLL